MTDTPETPPEYVPFDMVCEKCEHERVCVIPLKVANKLTRVFFRFTKEHGLTKRETFCRQGRKRRNCRQVLIQEIQDERRSRNAELPGVQG
jgi:hypothetical protein